MKNNYTLLLIALSVNIVINSSSSTLNIQNDSRKRTTVVTFIDEASSYDTSTALPSNNRHTITIKEFLKENKKQRSLKNLHINLIPKIDHYILSQAEQDADAQFQKLKAGDIKTNSIQHNFTQRVQLADVLQYLRQNKKRLILQPIDEKIKNFESTEEFDLTEHQDCIQKHLQNSLTVYHNKFWATFNQLKKQDNI